MESRNNDIQEKDKVEKENPSFFDLLPDEVIQNILAFLMPKGEPTLWQKQGFQQVMTARLSDRRFRNLVDDLLKQQALYLPNPTNGLNIQPSFEMKEKIKENIAGIIAKFSSATWTPRFYRTLEEARSAPDLHGRKPNEREVFIFTHGELSGYIDGKGNILTFAKEAPSSSKREKEPTQVLKLKSEEEVTEALPQTIRYDLESDSEDEVPLTRKKSL